MASHEIENLDFSKIAALQQKRTLAFVNHFIISTVQFLNNFAKKCEERLMNFERKLEKINASMVLLEAKLSSIPEINAPENNLLSQEGKSEQTKEEHKSEIATEQINEIASNDQIDTKLESKVKPEYERFIKMVQVGVPLAAVKLKISLEGLNPNELDNFLGR